MLRVRREFRARPAGHLPEARERRPAPSTRGRLPVARGACRRDEPRHLLREGRSSTRWSRRRSWLRPRDARPARSPTRCAWCGAGCPRLLRAAAARAPGVGAGSRRWRSFLLTRRRRCTCSGRRPRCFEPRAGHGRARRLEPRPAAARRRCSSASRRYSKPPNLLLALPLGLAPLLVPRARARCARAPADSARRGRGRGAGRAAPRSMALNAVVTGEFNYQGGERKTFYGTLPVRAAGRDVRQQRHLDDDEPASARASRARTTSWRPSQRCRPLRSAGRCASPSCCEPRLLLVRPLRRASLPYFFPVALLALALPRSGPARPQGLARARRLRLSYLVYIWLIPDNWYGGGGTVGNRYFLNLLPLALCLVPRGRELARAAERRACRAPVPGRRSWRAPLRHSLAPGRARDARAVPRACRPS